MRIVIGLPGGQKDARSWDGEQGRRVRYLAKLLRRMQPGLPEKTAKDRAVEVLRHIWDGLRQDGQQLAASGRLLLPASNNAVRINPDWWRMAYVESDDAVFQCSVCGRISSVSVRGVCPRPYCNGSLQELARRDLPENHYRSLYEEHLPGALRVEEHTAQLTANKAHEFQEDFKSGRIHVLSSSTTFELGVNLGDLSTVFLRNVHRRPSIMPSESGVLAAAVACWALP